MNFLSIDQSANASGWCYWENNKPSMWGVIYPSPKSAKGGRRLANLRDSFEDLIKRTKVKIVCIEDPVGGAEDKSGPEQNWKTMKVLSQVHGMLSEIVYRITKEEPFVYSPSSWQYSTSIHKRDRASRKAGAQAFVERTYGIKDCEQDVYDAVCIGWHHLNGTAPTEERSAF